MVHRFSSFGTQALEHMGSVVTPGGPIVTGNAEITKT